jgi:4-amino-4-deoxy-L-arabinose transferase-like glycosyltransferase
MFVTLFGPGVLGQWAPLYDGLLAAVFAGASPDPVAAKALQVCLSTATIAGVYALAGASGSLRAARLAAALCALDPTLIAFSHYLFSETLFIALLVAAACALFAAPQPRSRRRTWAAGALFGLAILTRSVGLYFLVLWAAWEWLRGRRQEAADAARVLAVALLVVLPWTARNAFKYHDFLLVDATLGRTAYFAFGERFFSWDLGYAGSGPVRPLRDECAVGLAPGAPQLPPAREIQARLHPTLFGLTSESAAELPIWRTRRFATEDLAAGQRCELANALAFAREHPTTVAGHVAHRFYALWGPNSYLLRSVFVGTYEGGPLERATYPLWKAVVVALHVLAGAGALLALGRRRLPPFVAWSALFVGYYTVVHMLAVAYSRYRLPLMPFVFVAAALWLCEPRAPEGRARRLAVGGSLLGFVALCVHYAIVRLP